MALDGCSQICKCVLISINILFGLVGFTMLGLGMWLRYSSVTQRIFDVNLDTQQFVAVNKRGFRLHLLTLVAILCTSSGVILLIVLGAVMLIISILGSCGACTENKCCLAVFCFLLLGVAGAEIAAGVLTFQNKNKVGEQLSLFYHTVYLQYVNTDRDASMAITLQFFHNTFECCGILGAALEPIVRSTCPNEGFIHSLTIPSCTVVIPDVINSKAPGIVGGFLAIAAIMICTMVCSCILYTGISRSRMEPIMTITGARHPY